MEDFYASAVLNILQGTPEIAKQWLEERLSNFVFW